VAAFQGSTYVCLPYDQHVEPTAKEILLKLYKIQELIAYATKPNKVENKQFERFSNVFLCGKTKCNLEKTVTIHDIRTFPII
jgi:hypothetical protein